MADARVLLVTTPISAGRRRELQAAAGPLRVEQCAFDQVPAELWRAAEVLLTRWGLPAAADVPTLSWIQLSIAGAEHVLNHELLLRPGVVVTSASGVHAVTIAEYVFAMLLARARRVPRLLEHQRQRLWLPDAERYEVLAPDLLQGGTLGVVGYGSIGRQVARVGRGLGMRVVAMQRGTDHRDHGYLPPEVGDPDGRLPERYYQPGELHALLAASDVVVLSLPLTPQTRGLVDAAALRAMRRSAVLVNVGRGALVDEEALLRALGEGWIGGAILDTFATEPLAADSRLWDAPNVLLTPHISGLQRGYDDLVVEVLLANLRRYLAGEPLLNVVDPARGY